MAAVEAPGHSSGVARMRLMCSHGGRFLPCGPNGTLRHVGGETRVIVVPRAVTFRDLTARLSEMAGGEVRAVRHCLADEYVQDVIVSVTCDEELAHMRDEYDRLRATRPSATFRVFVTTTTTHGGSGGGVVCRRRSSAGLPPLPLEMRRAQSEQALAVRAHQQQAKHAMRRVQSTQEFVGAIHLQSSFHFHHRCNQPCCRSSQRRNVCALALAAAQPVCCRSSQRRNVCALAAAAQPMCALSNMSKKVTSPWMPAEKAIERVFVVRV